MGRAYQGMDKQGAHPWRRKIRAVVHMGTILALIGMGACAVHEENVNYRPYFADDNPATLVDTYMMAHGMAQGRVISGGLSVPEVKQIIRLDYITLLTVMHQIDDPSDEHLQTATGHIQSLLHLIDVIGQKYQPPSAYKMLPPGSYHHAAPLSAQPHTEDHKEDGDD